MRKLTVVIITALMLCVSFTIVSTDDAEGLAFVNDFPAFPDGSFVPNDVVWNTQGSVALAVGTGSLGNVWVYDIHQPAAWLGPFGGVVDTSQVLSGACYDTANQLFWFCGNIGGSTLSTVYFWDPPSGLDGAGYLTGGSGALMIPVNDVAVDMNGNPCAVGTSTVHYFDGANWNSLTGLGMQEEYMAIDYNQADDRFYFGGLYTGTRGSSEAGKFYFTDVDPRVSCYPVSSYIGTEYGAIFDIAWNQGFNYGLVVGETVIKVTGTAPTYECDVIESIELIESMETYYHGVSWNTFDWSEAAIVGEQFQTGLGYGGTYWRYYHHGNEIIFGYRDASAVIYNCVGFKPPSSPKWVLIPGAGGAGGIRINVFMIDQGTQVRVNTAFPHIFAIDLWDQADPGQNSLLKTEVDVLNEYTFFLQGNYSIDMVDHWLDAELELTAWFDGGIIQSASTPLNGGWNAPDYRTRQFRVFYNIGNDTAWLTYPTSAPFEFSLHSWNYSAAAGDHYNVTINVTFEQQTFAADGSLFINPTTNISDRDFSLLNANSWDFNYSLYDRNFASARSSAYEEFGVKEAVAIIASGNPTGNAPPGSGPIPLGPESTITYSANTPYWVNVSIPDLYLNGVPGPDFIPASNIAVRNDHVWADQTYSEIAGVPVPAPDGFLFPGPGVDYRVWGNASSGTPMPAPLNGTQAAGVSGSDYTDITFPGTGVTPVYWWATVPSVPEGVYWAIITFSIYDT